MTTQRVSFDACIQPGDTEPAYWFDNETALARASGSRATFATPRHDFLSIG
ncbi:MAG TPA: hypothetical protein PK646_06475 [Bacillota bacterium]|jgi:hypothetical protein|nr:hypothetical protein [Fastidiosipila sp.]HPX93849.1 hypothetical protein [Bacillota bacterium]HQB81714.1 hypothetical protein [Bacillota bacterium]